MRNCFLSIIVALFCHPVFSQETNSDVFLGVVCPEKFESFSTSGLHRLSQKMTEMATRNGVAAFYDGAFVMYPTLSVYDIQVVEGGMKNITKLKVDLSINVAQIGTKTLVGSISTVLVGSGFSTEEATTNAISNINARDRRYAIFISDCKRRIYEYDESNAISIIRKAKSFAAQQKYEEALSMLALYPESLPSYPLVSDAIIEIFKKYQKETAARLLTEAKSAIAIQDYNEAVKLLSSIDPDSPYHQEALNLITSIKSRIDQEKQAEIEREQKAFESKMALKRDLIGAAKDVAMAYLSNQPKISYNQIIK